MHGGSSPALTAALRYLNTQGAPLFHPHPFLRYLGCDCALSAADHANFVIVFLSFAGGGHVSACGGRGGESGTQDA